MNHPPAPTLTRLASQRALALVAFIGMLAGCAVFDGLNDSDPAGATSDASTAPDATPRDTTPGTVRDADRPDTDPPDAAPPDADSSTDPRFDPLPACQQDDPACVDALTFSAGGAHQCIITKDRTQLLCRGDNSQGQLGYATDAPAHRSTVFQPVDFAQVFADDPSLQFVDVAAGLEHTCAIVRVGAWLTFEIYCWGSNQANQFPRPENQAAHRPVLVKMGPEAGIQLQPTEIMAGRAHTCIRNALNAIFCWGNHSRAQLGNGHAPSVVGTFGKVVALHSAQSLATLADHSCIIGKHQDHDLERHAFCWGYNNQGQLGFGRAGGTWEIPQVVVPPDLANQRVPEVYYAIATGVDHTCAVASTLPASEDNVGQVYCWGNGTETAKLGVFDAALYAPSLSFPVNDETGAPLQATQVALGAKFSCALSADKLIRCWGGDNSGQFAARPLAGMNFRDVEVKKLQATPHELCALFQARDAQEPAQLRCAQVP